jgi:DNA repair exonuclease SbcCD ATPase subunit
MTARCKTSDLEVISKLDAEIVRLRRENGAMEEKASQLGPLQASRDTFKHLAESYRTSYLKATNEVASLRQRVSQLEAALAIANHPDTVSAKNRALRDEIGRITQKYQQAAQDAEAKYKHLESLVGRAMTRVKRKTAKKKARKAKR